MSHLLIVEDEPIIRSALKRLLERNNYEVSEAASVKEARHKYTLSDFDMIISDLRLPGAPGTDLIDPANDVPVLIMTSYASLKSAVDAMRKGAVDYVAKPFDHDEMLNAVTRILKLHRERTTSFSNQPKKNIPTAAKVKGMIGGCPAMKTLFAQITKIAPTNATVLVNGETGTGKELVAKSIHEQSPRAHKPLISVNCAAIPETLIEAELFGHEKGAFTGAATSREGLIVAAEGGTLFLDEIGELPIEAQARLLRVLQESEVRPLGSTETQTVDVRIIAATHRDLKTLSSQGLFREDLYYRINVLQLALPALRDRGRDVLDIANKLLVRACDKHNREALKLSPHAIQAITTYRWPGNIREMENAIERATILCENDQDISIELLGIDLEPVNLKPEPEPEPESDPYKLIPVTRANIRKGPSITEPSVDPKEDLSLEDYFQRFVLEHQDQMSETELAQKLGVSRKCLWERRQRFGLPRKKANK